MDAARYEELVKNLRASTEKGHLEMLDSYLNGIKEIYLYVPQSHQRFILNRLEGIVKGLESNDVEIKEGFDRVQAKEIRERTGLSQKELGFKLGFSNSCQTSISDYETGKKAPSSRGKFGKAYMDWLIENDYK